MLMETDIKVIGKMIKGKESEKSCIQTTMYMRGISKMTIQMEKELCFISMVTDMKDNGLME